MSNKYQIKGGSVDQNINKKGMEFFDCLKLLCLKIKRQHKFGICDKSW